MRRLHEFFLTARFPEHRLSASVPHYLLRSLSPFVYPNPLSPPAGQVATPSIDPEGGTYYDEIEITLACETEGASIYYTTDGSDPTELSPLYSSPFAITESCSVKAKAFKSGWTPSEIASSAYTIYSSTFQFGMAKYGTGAATQAIQVGNYDGCVLSIDQGTITAISGGTIRPGSGDQIADLDAKASGAYSEITFSAIGENIRTVTITHIQQFHYFYCNTSGNGARITNDSGDINFAWFPELQTWHTQYGTYKLIGDMPPKMKYIRIFGEIWECASVTVPDTLYTLCLFGLNIDVTLINTTPPAGITYIRLYGNKILGNWAGSFNNGCTFMYLAAANFEIHIDELPSSLVYLVLAGKSYWSGSDNLPSGLTTWTVQNSYSTWANAGALPDSLNSIYINAPNIDWTGTDFGQTGNWPPTGALYMFAYAQTSLSWEKMKALLTSIAGRTGLLPNTMTIGDYDNNPTTADIVIASPVIDGTPAEQLKYWLNAILAKANVNTINFSGQAFSG